MIDGRDCLRDENGGAETIDKERDPYCAIRGRACSARSIASDDKLPSSLRPVWKNPTLIHFLAFIHVISDFMLLAIITLNARRVKDGSREGNEDKKTASGCIRTSIKAMKNMLLKE